MRPRSSNSRNPGSRIPRRGGLSSTSLNYQKEARCIAPVLRMSGYKRGVHRQLTRVKHCNGRNSERVVPNKELANAKEQPGEPKEYNAQIQRKSAFWRAARSHATRRSLTNKPPKWMNLFTSCECREGLHIVGASETVSSVILMGVGLIDDRGGFD